MNIAGVIGAGGQGTRLGIAGGKQLLELAGRPIAAWAVDALAAAQMINEILVVCDPERVDEYVRHIGAAVQTDKPLTFVAGGDTREDSVCAGLASVPDADIVAVHDGSRPLLDPRDADAVIQRLIDDCDIDGAVLGHPAVDTIKRVDNCQIVETPDRTYYWHAQTPQVFHRKFLADAYAQAKTEGYQGTDDASYVEYVGGTVAVVRGSRNNIKVTVAEDVEFVNALFAIRNVRDARSSAAALCAMEGPTANKPAERVL
ncbi:MAG: 2-C-methyl-D-erythritol 4-phosphate cytidylyltransferase [Coriobacteriia bacterium]|nr:2-C-methyl-D-erythritol 4-phosphate cytidylyltransferase [Coriobacteriia bacterium]